MRRFFSRFGMRWVMGLVLLSIALAQVLGFVHMELADRIDQFVYDTRMSMVPPKLDKRIVIVSVDEKSLSEVGRWPWARNVTADLVDQLFKHYQIRALAFDVMFSEPDTSSGYITLASLVRRELRDIPHLEQKLQALKPALDYDGRLAKAFENRPVVLGYFLSDKLQKGLPPAAAFTTADLNGYAINAYETKAYEANLPQLQKAARGGGFFNTDIDSDGLLRATPLMMRVGDAYYESLALATARVALGAARVAPIFHRADAVNSEESLKDYGILDALQFDGVSRQIRIPVENKLMVRIHYRGHGGPDGGAYRYLSAVDVMQGKVPKETLAGAIVLVGTTAPGLNDMRATPVKSDYPGVEVHANLIASILDNDFKQQPEFSAGLDLLQVLLIGVILIVALSRMSPSWSILFAMAAGAAVIGFNSWMYFAHNMVLPVATVLLLIASLFVFNVAWGYLFEYRKGRAIVNLFGEYVAPELVAEMAKAPESYSMEGESRELTVLFADVRGFTTISEGLEPNALREYINLYLTAMSEDIRGNRGTLDKYIGDAVMAFWGAPVPLTDHAARAVATALKMQASAQRLNEDFIARGWPPLKIGIGLNTGEMRVGDMGSSIRRAYTVMGDAVNLSSRLEGITKVYGVGVVVGEGTKLAAPEFAYRELDLVQVKGKNEPVPIFEPLGLATEISDAMRDTLDRWHHALALVRAQDWDGAQACIEALLASHPMDGLYVEYLKRIAHYRQHPPGADWSGVTVFETK